MQTIDSIEQVFHFQNKPMRTVRIDGEPWFVAADVCGVLGLGNPSQAVSYLDEDERCLITNEAWRTNGGMVAVSEPGLYSLVLKSRRPEAKSFRRWITHEVIPVLRSGGSYSLPVPAATGQLIQFSRRDLLNLAVEAETECEELRGVVAELLPKADFFDRVADTSASFSLGETAKMMEIPGFGRNHLIRFLREDQGILMADNVAKQRYIDRGYFHIVQRDYCAPDGTPRVKAVTRVYEKGVDYIRHLLDDFLMGYMDRANSKR